VGDAVVIRIVGIINGEDPEAVGMVCILTSVVIKFNIAGVVRWPAYIPEEIMIGEVVRHRSAVRECAGLNNEGIEMVRITFDKLNTALKCVVRSGLGQVQRAVNDVGAGGIG